MVIFHCYVSSPEGILNKPNKTVKIFSVDLGPTTSQVGAFKKQMKLIEVQLAAEGVLEF